ncbi:MAG TPA: hypothetical protein VNA11_02790 [Pseudonocardia sp.]|jgi:hypothetical protein|nr:hypothetical protein [Pseudonocardia sp.]
MSPAFPQAAVLTPAYGPSSWTATEPVTSPIPVVEPPTNPIPVLGAPVITDSQHARHAAVLSGVVGLVMVAALLLALGVL